MAHYVRATKFFSWFDEDKHNQSQHLFNQLPDYWLSSLETDLYKSKLLLARQLLLLSAYINRMVDDLKL